MAAPGVLLPDRGASASRDRLLALIHRQPGVHKSALCEATGLAWGTVDYHLRMLARGGLVSAQPAGRATRLFPALLLARQREQLAALAEPPASRIAALLRRSPGQGNQALSQRLDLSSKVVRRHLLRLVSEGLVEREGTRRPVYRLRAEAEPLLDGLAPQGPAAAPLAFERS